MSELLAILFVAGIVVAFLFYLGWYRLQMARQEMSEAGEALQVLLRTKLELTRQAMAACAEQADGEKLAKLQVSGEMAGSFKDLPKANAHAENALAYVSQLAMRHPELKADGRFAQVTSQLENLGNQLDTRHAEYNSQVEAYNQTRAWMPAAVVAWALRLPEARSVNFGNWMILLQSRR